MKNKVKVQDDTQSLQSCVSDSAFLAFMRIDCEGIFEKSIKLFRNKTEAGKYICELRKKHGTCNVTYEILDLHYH